MARKTVSRKRKAAAAAAAGTGGLQGEQVKGEAGGRGEALVPGGGKGEKRWFPQHGGRAGPREEGRDPVRGMGKEGVLGGWGSWAGAATVPVVARDEEPPVSVSPGRDSPGPGVTRRGAAPKCQGHREEEPLVPRSVPPSVPAPRGSRCPVGLGRCSVSAAER